MKQIDLPTTKAKVQTIILANGAYPENEIPLALLQNGQRIICCDGATNQLLQHSSREPYAIVGDCDSLSEDIIKRFSNIIHQVSEQETNDLTKAVTFARRNGLDEIVILGATGKREDHTLGNISLLAEYIDNGISIQLVTDYGVFTAIKEPTVFESFPGQQVSIFSIDHQPITSINLSYPIENRIFTSWWQGTLNESESYQFTLQTKGKVIVFRSFAE